MGIKRRPASGRVVWMSNDRFSRHSGGMQSLNFVTHDTRVVLGTYYIPKCVSRPNTTYYNVVKFYKQSINVMLPMYNEFRVGQRKSEGFPIRHRVLLTYYNTICYRF